jgi:hypothetical protein
LQATKRAETRGRVAAAAEQQAREADLRASNLSSQLIETISNFEGLVSAANTAQAALIQRTRRQTVGGNDAAVMQGVADSLQNAITDREKLLADAKKDAEAVAQVLKVCVTAVRIASFEGMCHCCALCRMRSLCCKFVHSCQQQHALAQLEQLLCAADSTRPVWPSYLHVETSDASVQQ